MAVVASMLSAIDHMLKDGTMSHDLGCDHFERHSTDSKKNRLVERLSELGYAVTSRLSLHELVALPGVLTPAPQSYPPPFCPPPYRTRW